MSESDRAFLATVAQVVPVRLLALVVEARVFKSTYQEALPSLRQARTDLRKTMPAFVYWGWRFQTMIRRWGIGLGLSVGLAVSLALAELAALLLLAQNQGPTASTTTMLIVALAAGSVVVGVMPMMNQIVQRNIELASLELELERAMNETLEREAEEQARLARAKAGRRTWWQRLKIH